MRQDTTTYHGEAWQTVNGIVEPVTGGSEHLLPKGAEKAHADKPAVKSFYGRSVVNDSLLKAREDSVIRAKNDSAAREHASYGIVLQTPYLDETPAMAQTGKNDGMSWVFVGLAVLFCVICLRFKKNTRYIRALVYDLTQVRMRHNAFDDTVKETSFLLLLNLLWVCSAGVLLWKTVTITVPYNPFYSFSIPDRPALGIALCCGVSLAYVLIMTLAYTVVGNVFSDSRMTGMWVKGSLASQALEAAPMFILALLALCYSPATETILLVAAGVFVLGKIIFLYKGFRIFFNQISSWLLFLYYLCSLEIVPLILAYFAALQICAMLL